MQIQETQELTIEPVNEEIFDLETLITQGTDSFIPLKFIYPGTEKTVGVFIKPISTKEFNEAMSFKDNIIMSILSFALYDNNKTPVPQNIIEQLPAGVTLELYKKVAEISGIPTEPEDSDKITDKLMGF